MADATTPNYGFTKPEVNGSDDTWGDKLNGNWDELDAKLKEVEDSSGVPIGTVIGFLGEPAPGFVEFQANRIGINPATYPDLEAYLRKDGVAVWGEDANGWAQLPGMDEDGTGDGLFFRAWVAGGSRVWGSFQDDALQNITGTMPNVLGSSGFATTDGTGAIRRINVVGNQVTGGSGGRQADVTFDASLVARTADETRPRNLSLRFAIKAFSAVVNTGMIDVAGLASDLMSVTARVESAEDRITALESLSFGTVWTDKLADRASNTTYTNTTGKMLAVSAWAIGATSPYLTFYVDGVVIGFGGNSWSSSNQQDGVFFVVPPGSTYKISLGSGHFNGWNELI